MLGWLAAGIVVGTGGEIYLRLTHPYVTPDTRRDASLEYEVTLFSRHTFPKVEKRKTGKRTANINGRGYRGRLFAVSKPPGVVRVIVLGGSAAFDIYASQGKDWPSLVEARLHSMGHKNVEVINAAVPGHATWDSLGRLYAEIWMFEPDYILVYHAWNDLKYFNWLDPDMSLLRGYRPWPGLKPAGLNNEMVLNPHLYYTGAIDKFLCTSQIYVRLRTFYWTWRLRRIDAKRLRARGDHRQVVPRPETYLTDYSPWGPRQYKLDLALIADAARDIGATPLFLTQVRLVSPDNTEDDRKRIAYNTVWLAHDALARALDECDRAVLEVAREKDLRALDLSGMLSGRPDLMQDEVHTNSRGSQAIANATADFLVDVMREERPIMGVTPAGRTRP